MDTIPCPGCRTDLEPSATVCPICLRPRGKLEITRAYATMREMEKQRKQRPFIVAGYLLAAGAAGWLLLTFRAPLIAGAVWARASAGRFFDRQLATALPPVPAAVPPAPAPSAPPAAVPAPPGVSAPAAPRAASPVAAEPGAGAPAEDGAAAKAGQRRGRVEDLPLPAFDSSAQWVIFGRIYDLVTLRPIPDAQLTFTAVSGNNGGAGSGGAYGPRSDAEGRFTAVLQRLPDGSSYEIHASRSGYASAALYESDIPYARLPLSERRDIVHNAQDGDMTLPPLNDVAGEGSMRRDVFLAPSR
jgi:hypothetical protein